jgi:NCS1 family nucleobase:cation symporter-1
MSASTIFGGLRDMDQISTSRKAGVMFILIAVAAGLSVLVRDHFQAYFGDVLGAVIYLLVPWSAINLSDYYLVRHGDYRIPELFRVDGIYGAYRWKTITIYLLAIAIQWPFMSFSFYQGVIAQRIGSDISWLPGLLVPALLYVLAYRGRLSVA